MFRDGSLILFRGRGVPMRAHWTLLLIVPYLTAELVGEVFDELRIKDFLPSHGPLPVVGADDFIDDAIARMGALDRLELVVIDRGASAAVIDADDAARTFKLRAAGAATSTLAHRWAS